MYSLGSCVVLYGCNAIVILSFEGTYDNMSDQDTNAPWRNKELLREKYWCDEQQMSEIADDFGCSYHTVLNWMQRFGIERRGKNGSQKSAKYKQEDYLREMYISKDKSTADIADELSVANSTIAYWLRKKNIKKDVVSRGRGSKYRDKNYLQRKYVQEGLSLSEIADDCGTCTENVRRWAHKHDLNVKGVKSKHPNYFTRKNGYEVVRDYFDGDIVEVRIHRLVAIANGELDPSEVNGSQKHVHHKNRIRYDNRPDNLEVLSASDHMKIHGGEARQD